MVVGLHGCLRSKELLELTMDNTKPQGLFYDIKVYVWKTNTWKSFTTSAEVQPILDKYIKVTPPGMEKARFLLPYCFNKCT